MSDDTWNIKEGWRCFGLHAFAVQRYNKALDAE